MFLEEGYALLLYAAKGGTTMENEQQQQPGSGRSESDEGTAERLGHQLGYAFGRINHTIHHLGSRQHSEKAQPASEGIEQAPQVEETTTSNSHPHMSRAEEVVDNIGHRLNTALSRTGAQFQKAGSRIREEAEDILAEARHIHTPPSKEEAPKASPPS